MAEDERLHEDEDLQWETIRPTERRKAVWLTPRNAQAVADHFGGSVEIVKSWAGVSITRLTLGNTSGPACGYVTDDGKWLHEADWEQDGPED